MTVTASSQPVPLSPVGAPTPTAAPTRPHAIRLAVTPAATLAAGGPGGAAAGAAELHAPNALMITLKNLVLFGVLGAGLGLGAGLLPILGGGLGVAPIITAAVGANIGAMFGFLEGSFKAQHALGAYDRAVAARDDAEQAARDAAAAASTAAAAQAARRRGGRATAPVVRVRPANAPRLQHPHGTTSPS